MPLIINQGKQNTAQDKAFEPIEAKGVLVQVTEVKLAEQFPDTLQLSMRVMDGQFKGRYVTDRVTFDAKSEYSWKYRSVRKAAGVPYQENEPASVDAESLFLNKAIRVDLGIRKGKNKEGVETNYQLITYKVLQATAPVKPVAQPKTKSVEHVTPVETPTKKEAPLPFEVGEEDWDK